MFTASSSIFLILNLSRWLEIMGRRESEVIAPSKGFTPWEKRGKNLTRKFQTGLIIQVLVIFMRKPTHQELKLEFLHLEQQQKQVQFQMWVQPHPSKLMNTHKWYINGL